MRLVKSAAGIKGRAQKRTETLCGHNRFHRISAPALRTASAPFPAAELRIRQNIISAALRTATENHQRQTGFTSSRAAVKRRVVRQGARHLPDLKIAGRIIEDRGGHIGVTAEDERVANVAADVP